MMARDFNQGWMTGFSPGVGAPNTWAQLPPLASYGQPPVAQPPAQGFPTPVPTPIGGPPMTQSPNYGTTPYYSGSKSGVMARIAALAASGNRFAPMVMRP